MSQFDWPITQKNEIMEARVPPLWPTSISERRTTIAKAHGIKVRCYGEHGEKHIENILGT
jgi:hypothetical protein